ncbi:hypothetical protein OTU49_011988, partial [Cherax quadricarinatus]
MFRASRLRVHTCKIVLVTSLVWFVMDVAVIMYYSDCTTGSGWGCGRAEAVSIRDSHADHHKGRAIRNHHSDNEDVDLTGWHLDYPPGELKRWVSKPTVPEQPGLPGEMGKPVRTPPEQEAVMKEKFKLNQFNLLASDSISLNRSLPDVRLEGCKTKMYPPLMPTTSIVIVFHNEAWSTLLRTVWSIIQRSPRALLQEILLVDDASER